MCERRARVLEKLKQGTYRVVEQPTVRNTMLKADVKLTTNDTKYASMTRAELLEIAKDMGLTGVTRLSKDKLVQAILQG